MSVVEYKCPQCGGRLEFNTASQRLECPYCTATYAIEDFDVQEHDERGAGAWETAHEQTEGRLLDKDGNWIDPASADASTATLISYTCPSCGGEIVGDTTMAASRCPYCDSPAIIPGQLQDSFSPDLVIPFKKTKADAQEAFTANTNHKFLLPKGYLSEQRIEDIAGLYVPYWLFDCSAQGSARYDATKERTISMGDKKIKKIKHYAVERAGDAAMAAIPVDGSSALPATCTESIEPFDTTEARPFQQAYLSGFLANRYDVESDNCTQRVRDRATETLKYLLRNSVNGYDSVTEQSAQVDCTVSEPQYALLPVWTLASRYRDKVYHFSMNGQTGKFTGELPISTGRTVVYFLLWLLAFFALALVVGAIIMDEPETSTLLIGSLITGLLLSGLVTLHARSKMNTAVEADNSNAYLIGDLNLTRSNDAFRYEETITIDS